MNQGIHIPWFSSNTNKYQIIKVSMVVISCSDQKVIKNNKQKSKK